MNDAILAFDIIFLLQHEFLQQVLVLVLVLVLVPVPL